MTETEIQNLILQSQRGDTEAFGRIYDLYAQKIFNFIFGKIRQKEASEDLAHTVFLKAWMNLKSYQPRSNAKFSTWLFQIANYTLIDYWRTKKPTVELREVENSVQFAQNPQHYEEYEYLWKALSKLSLEYQTVLDLRFRQDLSVAETAKIMGKSQVGVRVLQHRALKALRTKLNKFI